MTSSTTRDVNARQAPLRARYRQEPQAALVVDRARTLGSASDPFHAIVEPMPGSGTAIPVGVHRAVGGLHDAPTPGDLLCAALAACQDSTIRMLANLLGVELEFLSVRVEGDVDVRGTLQVSPEALVGFRDLRCEVHLRAREGTDPERLARLCSTAERCCVVQQTLRKPPVVTTTFSGAPIR